MHISRIVHASLLVCLVWNSLWAEEPEVLKNAKSAQANQPVDFARDIFPLLKRACFECHGEAKQEGGLRLDLRTEALQSASIEAGKPESSELLRRIALPRGHDDIMPAIGEPLSEKQIDLVRDWIAAGAPWPEAFEQPPHWSYERPVRPDLPTISDETWIRSPIDRFVLERLDHQGWQPSPLAEPEKRVRRLFLDLIGLPPTPAEVNAFVARPTPEHWEQLIDNLLERPQFGERWARPWLDLARYADSHGFQRDDLRDNWAYRDWVIRALNDDMPFDQFTIEQLAGDLLPNATESQRIATGFHRCAPTNVEAGSLPEETRVEQVLDRVNTTGAIWLGSTLECCQCHDHKYDPFTLKEYYQLFAFFNNTELEADLSKPDSPSSIKFQGPTMSLVDAERDGERQKLQSELELLNQQQAARRQALDRELEGWARQFSSQTSDSPKLHSLDNPLFSSQGTTDSHELLSDGRVLLVGDDPPDRDVYRLRASANCQHVTGFRLDVLQHDSLPGRGPGRGDARRQNFVLNDFSVEIKLPSSSDAKQQPRKLRFSSASASFSQKNWDVAGAIDDDAKSGWAISPKFDQAHWATFELAESIDLTPAQELTISLTQDFGQSRTIGCFRLTVITGNIDQKPIAQELLKLVSTPANQWSDKDRQKLLEACIDQDAQSAELASQIAKLKKRMDAVAPDTTLVMIELQQPRASTVFMRGDYKTPGESVSPATPKALHPLSPDLPRAPRNRLTLARWLASSDNPLVARAAVNRWWAELFGSGIVTTAEDLGVKGEPPSHPELLDWLAVELMQNGWSMKRLLKTIVLSSTYQQASRITHQNWARDDQNRWLARGPRLRMDAEMIRDNALSIAGLLDLKPGGAPIRPPQPDGIWRKVGGEVYDYQVSPGSEQYRRGVYVVLKRGAPYPSFVNFDATARLACTVRRSRTNTPLQALTLLNDPVYVAAAQGLANRVLVDRSSAPLEQQIAYAFQLCVARLPNDREQETLKKLIESQIAAEKAEATQLGKEMPSGEAERQAWLSLATTLLNLHETITKD